MTGIKLCHCIEVFRVVERPSTFVSQHRRVTFGTQRHAMV
jgi:hypothetical protein